VSDSSSESIYEGVEHLPHSTSDLSDEQASIAIWIIAAVEDNSKQLFCLKEVLAEVRPTRSGSSDPNYGKEADRIS
jgi:hypothetical protein